MSADRPSPALDLGYPLHAILSGFSEPAEDVLADDERGDGATVEPGPPCHSSAGRPLDEPDDELFTPPIPTLALHDLLGDERAVSTSSPIRERARDVLTALPCPPRPSAKVGAALLALMVVAAVVSTGDRQAEPPPATPSHAPDQGRPDRPDATARDRRPQRRRTHRRRSSRRAAPRATRRAVVHLPAPARVVPSSMPPPTPRPTGSHFTSEFTP